MHTRLEGGSRKLYEQFVDCVHTYGMPIDDVLPMFTCNVATALKLTRKGRLQAGNDADVMVLHEDTLEIAQLFARGRRLIQDGRLLHQSKQERQVEAGKE